MAWSAPMTAVAGDYFTATQFNTNIRDNLLESEAAKASLSEFFIVSMGANRLGTRRMISENIPSPIETTSSSSYTNLATLGPNITTETGARAVVWYTAWGRTSNTSASCSASVQVTGASNIPASDNWAIRYDGIVGGNYMTGSAVYLFTGLNPGVNTFRMQYRRWTSGTTGSFQQREMIVLPL